ncbi:hypothetical protein TNCV_2657921 [Trichonephila clavipes]|nr:hypothetical protein TNCV_2657921 [Trichonephila clavipes]
MIVYGIRPRPRHGQWSPHNKTVLPLLSVEMQFAWRIPVHIRTGIIFENYPYHDFIKIEFRTKRDPHQRRGRWHLP